MGPNTNSGHGDRKQTLTLWNDLTAFNALTDWIPMVMPLGHAVPARTCAILSHRSPSTASAPDANRRGISMLYLFNQGRSTYLSLRRFSRVVSVFRSRHVRVQCLNLNVFETLKVDMDYSQSPLPGSLPGYLHLPNSQPLYGNIASSVHPGHANASLPHHHHGMQMSRVNMVPNLPSMHSPHMHPGCPPTPPLPQSEAKMRLKACLTQQIPPHLANGNVGMMGGGGLGLCTSHHEALQPMTAHHSHGHGLHNPHGPVSHRGPHGHHLPHHPHDSQHQAALHHHSHHVQHHQQPGLTLQQAGGGGRRRRVIDEDPDERRRKFLERNRAAATRCRLKRKAWVLSLEKKAEELTQTNMQLQNEVALLRNEVSQLKQLLMAHKDCPVSAMKKSQGFLDECSADDPSRCSQVIQHPSSSSFSTTAMGSPVMVVSDMGSPGLCSSSLSSSPLGQLTTSRTDLMHGHGQAGDSSLAGPSPVLPLTS
uniref:cyclic AMP-responsive element-binding protein 5-like isoform X2 n=1 Tax=Myxine glutinosa TaxID=7769 RepID=UPI00358E57CF